MIGTRHIQTVAMIVHRADQILLVEQQGPDDPGAYWALPGGVVESGELPPEATLRELNEETGLFGGQIYGVVYLVFGVDRNTCGTASTIVFEADQVEGSIDVNDPDGVVVSAQFVDMHTARLRLRDIPWKMMREPVVNYLSGDSEPGTAWFYSHRSFKDVQLVAVIPAHH